MIRVRHASEQRADRSRVPLEVTPHERSVAYLRAKKDKMGHLLGKV